MGNCVNRCFGIIDRRKRYLRSKYNTEQDFSIENYYMDDDFENLMDEEPDHDEMSRLLTDNERQLLRTKQFESLVDEQRKVDEEIDAKLAQQEQEIEREEEAFYEAKREAARIAKLNKAKENTARNNLSKNASWAGDEEEWEIAGGEDEFEVFLASVKARSLATRAQVKNGSGDAQSSSSSNAQTKDKSLTEGSSLDMEWDHEAGMSPARKPNRVSEDSWSKPSTASPMHSSDLEWDPDFVSADNDERLQLINAASKQATTYTSQR